MNRTEHRLRMSFDPGYEEKWKLLTEYRKSARKEHLSMLRQTLSFVFLLLGCTLPVIVGLPPSPKALLVVAILSFLSTSAAITFFLYCSKVRIVRKELGL
jgi:NhaP-type Na+/H+ or K+/H+ antiporter